MKYNSLTHFFSLDGEKALPKAASCDALKKHYSTIKMNIFLDKKLAHDFKSPFFYIEITIKYFLPGF